MTDVRTLAAIIGRPSKALRLGDTTKHPLVALAIILIIYAAVDGIADFIFGGAL